MAMGLFNPDLGINSSSFDSHCRYIVNSRNQSVHIATSSLPLFLSISVACPPSLPLPGPPSQGAPRPTYTHLPCSSWSEEEEEEEEEEIAEAEACGSARWENELRAQLRCSQSDRPRGHPLQGSYHTARSHPTAMPSTPPPPISACPCPRPLGQRQDILHTGRSSAQVPMHPLLHVCASSCPQRQQEMVLRQVAALDFRDMPLTMQ